jgi:hypothetical protein
MSVSEEINEHWGRQEKPELLDPELGIPGHSQVLGWIASCPLGDVCVRGGGRGASLLSHLELLSEGKGAMSSLLVADLIFKKESLTNCVE